jgi:flagellar biosynthetic protein FlhB
MPEATGQERTEKATPRRRQKARDEGRVARSTELNSAIVILFGCFTLFVMGSHLTNELKQMMYHTMANAPLIASSDPTQYKAFGDYILRFFIALGPVFAVMVVIALGVNIMQVGFKITPKAVEIKPDKLDVVKGLQRLFSLRSLVTFIRDTLKLVAVGVVAYFAVSAEFDDFFLLADVSTSQLATMMLRMALAIVLKIGLAILIIAAFDYAYQKYEFEKSIRMTKQEVRDEFRDTEGSPQIKARVRQIQREMSRKRMMQDVPTADVVVTNPTHLAVAIKYDQDVMAAPQVVAKGERLVAKKIREIAIEHDIPIVEDKPLARSLFKTCDVGDLVPQKLYRAVAEILAYVYRIKGRMVG